MYRVTIMTGTAYAVKLDLDYNLVEEVEQLTELVIQGNPCIIIDDLDDLEEFGISHDKVQIVERD